MNLVTRISDSNEMVEGHYIETYNFCLKNFNKGNCASFYNFLKSAERNRFYTCPYGMSSYVAEDGAIFTCMRARNTYNRIKNKKFASMEDCKYNPQLSEKELLKLISCSNEEHSLTEKRATVDSISHEVKQLNSQIKEKCDLILQSFHLEDNNGLTADEAESLEKEIRTIYVSSSMIAGRFSLYDYEKNPESLSKGAIFPCNIYKKFDKIRKIFKNYMKKSVQLTISGSSYKCFDAYPSFELIPLLLIENSVKYSYKENAVEIHFKETDNNKLIVTISSYGPYCSEEDIVHAFEKGYRGKNAQRAADGSGIGLRCL